MSICRRLLAHIAIAIEIEGFKKADPDSDPDSDRDVFSWQAFVQKTISKEIRRTYLCAAVSLLHAEMHVKGALNAAFFTEERFPNPHPRVMINQCF